MKTISSIHNPIMQHLIGLKKNSDYRRECKSLLLEGKNAIFDVSKILKPKRIIISDHSLVPVDTEAEEVLCITDHMMHKLSSVKTCEGIIAEFPFPQETNLATKRHILALDRVRDPGNIGTLIRTALALHWDGIFFLPGCADPFGDKALRAAKGATFCIPLQFGTWEELHLLCHEHNFDVFVADFGGKAAERAKKETKHLLILGNEGEGICIPQEISHTVVSIPTASSMPSLNVAIAGGILMHTFDVGSSQ